MKPSSLLRKTLAFREPAVMITLFLILLVLTLLVILPATSMLRESVIEADGSLSLRRYSEFFSSSYFRNTLYNTLAIAGIATILALILGFLFAYTIVRTKVPLRGFFGILVLVPMLLPAFLIAFSLILLLGRNGLINQNLLRLAEFFRFPNPDRFQIQLYGPGGVILAQTLSFFPMSFLLFRSALSAIDPRMEEAAADLGANYWYTLFHVTLPLMAPAAFGSALLLFMFNASAFGAPALLGGRGLFFGNASMLAPEAILQTLGARSDWGMGATLAVVLVIPSLVLYFTGEYYLKKRSFITVSGTPTAYQPQEVPKTFRWLLFTICLLTSGFILLIVLVVALGAFTQTWGVNYTFTLRHIQTALTASRRSINNSILLAGVGGFAAAFFGTLSAYLFIRKPFLGVKILDFISMLPYALPGMVMGLGFAIAFSGRITFLVMSGTWSIIALNHFIRRMPYGIRSAASSIKLIDPTIEEAAADLGGKPVYSFLKVSLPLLKASFFASFIFGFINMMTDITAVIFLVSPRWRLLAVDIFNAIDAARYGTAAALSLIMITGTLLVLYLVQILFRVKIDLTRR